MLDLRWAVRALTVYVLVSFLVILALVFVDAPLPLTGWVPVVFAPFLFIATRRHIQRQQRSSPQGGSAHDGALDGAGDDTPDA